MNLEKSLQQVRDNNPDDYSKLYSFASEWVKTIHKAFSSEDLKKAYFDAGNEQPRQLNIFGAVFNALSKEKAIYKKGVTCAKLPQAHHRLLNTWISKEYRLQQQKNRLTNAQSQTALFN